MKKALLFPCIYFLCNVVLITFGFSLNSFSQSGTQPQQSQWNFTRDIAVNYTGIQFNDAVVLVELNTSTFDFSKANTDGSDIRFSLQSNRIQGSGLSYWIEQWNINGISRLWVKIPKLPKKSTTSISMFYGNQTALAVSNGDKTFLFFDDFNGNSISNKWTNVSIESVKEEGGLLKLKEADGQNGIIRSNFDVTDKMIIRTNYQRENGDRHWVRTGISAWNKWLSWGDYYTTDGYDDGYLMLFNDSVNKLYQRTTTLHPDDKWHTISYSYDGKKLQGFRDKDSVEMITPNAVSKLGIMTLDNDACDLYDFITVANFVNPIPKVVIGIQKPVIIKSK